MSSNRRRGIGCWVLCVSVLALFAVQPGVVGQAPGCANAVSTPGSESCDSSLAAFTLTLNEIVRLDIPGASFVTHNTSRTDLLSQFVPIGTFDLTVFSVTDYEVTANKSSAFTLAPGGTTGDTGLGQDQIFPNDPVDLNALLEINLQDPVGDEGDSDDPVAAAAFAGQGFVDLPDFGVITLWTGGNTEGGTSTSHVASAAIRFDLAALKNNASGNVYTFTLNLRVLER